LLSGIICSPGSLRWNDAVDQLNAAQSGALASNLPHQVNDYLIPQVRKWNLPADKFKYINIQIGSNDLCWSCAQATLGVGPGSADDFEANIRATLEALRTAIREHFFQSCDTLSESWWFKANSVVNLIAVFKLSDIYQASLHLNYVLTYSSPL
jgi:phospholipase B1